jgi:hypothetical protein
MFCGSCEERVSRASREGTGSGRAHPTKLQWHPEFDYTSERGEHNFGLKKGRKREKGKRTRPDPTSVLQADEVRLRDGAQQDLLVRVQLLLLVAGLRLRVVLVAVVNRFSLALRIRTNRSAVLALLVQTVSFIR